MEIKKDILRRIECLASRLTALERERCKLEISKGDIASLLVCGETTTISEEGMLVEISLRNDRRR